MSIDVTAHAIGAPASGKQFPVTKRLRRRAVMGVLACGEATGLWRRLGALGPQGLDILLHHRIADPDDPSFFGFKGNISATPDMFARQLDYLQQHHSVIGLEQFEGWLTRGRPLPPRPVLITFDDGYADNYSAALPELQKRSMPAVLFLATGYVGNRRTFYWDAVADAFARTKRKSAALPLLGTVELATAEACEHHARRWIEAAKRIDGDMLGDALAGLGAALDCELSIRPPHGTHADWDELRAMVRGGFAVCPHTVNHPILSRVSLEQAREEIAGSAADIERQLGVRERTFAYPNGGPEDFGRDHEQLLADLGFLAALRSEGGRALLREAGPRPFAVRRIGISLRDNVARFAAKLAGLARFATA